MQTKIEKLTTENLHESLELFIKEYNERSLTQYPKKWGEFTKEVRESEEDTRKQIENGKMSGYVMTEDNKIIGMILVTEPNYIRKLAVDSAYTQKVMLLSSFIKQLVIMRKW